ncbi:hypothetical protein KQI63_07285 [bacterium]|nr:hypothetical protein [bacterium]
MKRTSMFLVLFVLLFVASTSIAAPPPPDPLYHYEHTVYGDEPTLNIPERPFTDLDLSITLNAYSNAGETPIFFAYTDAIYINDGDPVLGVTITGSYHNGITQGSGGLVSVDGTRSGVAANNNPQFSVTVFDNNYFNDEETNAEIILHLE